MKLRIQGNSLRLRLSEQEVVQFAQTGQVAETVAFGLGAGQSLHYILARRDAAAAVTVAFTGQTIMIYVSEAAAAAWIANSHTPLSGLVENGTPKALKILIETDLGCRHEA